MCDSKTNANQIKTALAGQAARNSSSQTPNPSTTRPSMGAAKDNTMNQAIEFPCNRKDAAEALTKLRGFIGAAQLAVIGELCQGEERRYIYSKLVELANTVTTMPVTYETDGQGDQALVHLHYFTSGADWYITERDCEKEQLQAFGKADLGIGYPELGYISIVELLECGAELDLHWSTRKLAEI